MPVSAAVPPPEVTLKARPRLALRADRGHNSMSPPAGLESRAARKEPGWDGTKPPGARGPHPGGHREGSRSWPGSRHQAEAGPGRRSRRRWSRPRRSTAPDDKARRHRSGASGPVRRVAVHPGDRRPAGAGGGGGASLPLGTGLAAGRLPRRRSVLRDQRLPDHFAADRRPPQHGARQPRRVLAKAGAAAAAGCVHADRGDAGVLRDLSSRAR